MPLGKLFARSRFDELSSSDGRGNALFQAFESFAPPTARDEDWKYSPIQSVEFGAMAPLSGFKPEFQYEGGCSIEETKLPIAFKPNDKLEAAVGAFSSGTFSLKVKEGASAKARAKFSPTASAAINLSVTLEPNSTLDYCEDYSSPASSLFFGCRTRFTLLEGSALNYNCVQRFGEGVFSIINKDFGFNGPCSQANMVQCEMGASFSRVKAEQHFDADGASAPMHKAVFYGSANQHFDLSTNAYHKARDTKSDIVVKGALDGKSSSVYRGLIQIAKGAKGTDSFLQDRVLHLGKGVSSNSIPGLKIDENDVRASHGATVSKLSEESLFYLAARGIRRKQAQRLVVEGFVNDIVNSMPDPVAREIASQTLVAKLSV